MAKITDYRHIPIGAVPRRSGCVTLRLRLLDSSNGKDIYAYGAACSAPGEAAWSRSKGRWLADMRLEWLEGWMLEHHDRDPKRALCGVISVDSGLHPETVYAGVIKQICAGPRCPKWLKQSEEGADYNV